MLVESTHCFDKFDSYVVSGVLQGTVEVVRRYFGLQGEKVEMFEYSEREARCWVPDRCWEELEAEDLFHFVSGLLYLFAFTELNADGMEAVRVNDHEV